MFSFLKVNIYISPVIFLSLGVGWSVALDDIVRKEPKSFFNRIREAGYYLQDRIGDFWYNLKFDRRSIMPSALSLATAFLLHAGASPSRASTGRAEDEVRVEQTTYGTLTFQQVLKDGVNGVDGLYRANSVTVSPDGKSVYAAGIYDDAVAVFQRDLATGRLTFQQVLKDGVNGVDGLGYATSVTVSPDGKSVYAAGDLDNAVAVFQRDLATGRLTFQQVLKDGVNGVDGLDNAFSVTVSPDNKNVYAAGKGDDAVAVFQRDLTNGTLTFQQVLKDGVNGVDGLNGAFSVTVSPDNKNVYAAGALDDAVAVFQRDIGEEPSPKISGQLFKAGTDSSLSNLKLQLYRTQQLQPSTTTTTASDGSFEFVFNSRDDLGGQTGTSYYRPGTIKINNTEFKAEFTAEYLPEYFDAQRTLRTDVYIYP